MRHQSSREAGPSGGCREHTSRGPTHRRTESSLRSWRSSSACALIPSTPHIHRNLSIEISFFCPGLRGPSVGLMPVLPGWKSECSCIFENEPWKHGSTHSRGHSATPDYLWSSSHRAYSIVREGRFAISPTRSRRTRRRDESPKHPRGLPHLHRGLTADIMAPLTPPASGRMLSLDQIAAKRVDVMLNAMREEALLRHGMSGVAASHNTIQSGTLSSSSRNSSYSNLSMSVSSPRGTPTSFNTSPRGLEPAHESPLPFMLSELPPSAAAPSPLRLRNQLQVPALPAERDSTIRDLEDTCVSGLVALQRGSRPI